MTSTFLLGTLTVGLGLSAVAVAQEPGIDALKGAEVTITGCVATDKEESFVLANVQEILAPRLVAASPTILAMTGMEGGGPNQVIYWLSHDSVKLMRGHLGHKVQVTGVITDLSMGTVRVKQEPGKKGPDNAIEVEARGKEATAETDAPVQSGTGGHGQVGYHSQPAGPQDQGRHREAAFQDLQVNRAYVRYRTVPDTGTCLESVSLWVT